MEGSERTLRPRLALPKVGGGPWGLLEPGEGRGDAAGLGLRKEVSLPAANRGGKNINMIFFF